MGWPSLKGSGGRAALTPPGVFFHTRPAPPPPPPLMRTLLAGRTEALAPVEPRPDAGEVELVPARQPLQTIADLVVVACDASPISAQASGPHATPRAQAPNAIPQNRRGRSRT